MEQLTEGLDGCPGQSSTLEDCRLRRVSANVKNRFKGGCLPERKHISEKDGSQSHNLRRIYKAPLLVSWPVV